tara:strand:+ start:283 stop:501 length:219 start_codon:yes stop_codon:yes gene_type:complete
VLLERWRFDMSTLTKDELLALLDGFVHCYVSPNLDRSTLTKDELEELLEEEEEAEAKYQDWYEYDRAEQQAW